MDGNEQEFAVWVGLDVGKGKHYAVAQDRQGKVLLSRELPNDEDVLRDILREVMEHGPVLLVVDQPATVGALPVAVAQACGVQVGYLPGLTMRRMADTLPGEAKTDARDALVIATTARTSPHTIRALALVDDERADLTMLCGFDRDLVQQSTAAVNRIRGILTQLHPALERVLGQNLHCRGVLELLQKWPTPAALKQAGPTRIATFLKRQGSRKAAALAADIMEALGAQTVVVAGTPSAAQILPKLSAQLLLVRAQRAEIALQVEELVDGHPLGVVLMSMPGVGVGTAATILVTTGGKTFASAAHLAAYAGIAPVSRRSGSSLKAEYASKRGNKRLKDALYQSASSSLFHPPSRRYYERKKAEGRHHTQAILCLARRRVDVLYAMMRDGTVYQSPTP